jgi:Na+-driven multidrug efflux pump
MDMCDTNGGNSEVSLNGSNHTGTKNAELEELNVNAREEVSQEPSNASGLVSYKKLFTFIGATIMIWLSEPLLSLVDTTVVGKFASGGAKSALKGVSPSVVQLAALGPATMLIDNFFYFTYCLSIATTNQLATASATSNTPSKIKTTSHSLGVAAALGVMITSILFFFGKPLLSFCLGNGGIVNGVDMTPEVLSAALGYVRIRGVIAPLTVMGIIAVSEYSDE